MSSGKYLAPAMPKSVGDCWKAGVCSLLYEPVYYHHRPGKAKDHPLITKIIHLADSMVDEMKLGTSGEVVANPVKPKILQALGFAELPIEKFEEDIKDQYYTALSAFL